MPRARNREAGPVNMLQAAQEQMKAEVEAKATALRKEEISKAEAAAKVPVKPSKRTK